ncbi:hypothetical protein HQN90_09220 [Paenibacillus alba]|uniref:hypothetical protein n=1 Tax=Paenibacillus alba TaxID=1197127 RepID=UPI001564A3CD|nr:hypothetical protein [Paenibacillus alba]NQX66305.1 hypothetical protein [Paenibacillus alba]
MKPIKIEDREIIDAINSGAAYFEIDSRKFMLFEVESLPGSDIYEVQDEEEKNLLLEALNGDNPTLSEAEVDVMLGISKDS